MGNLNKGRAGGVKYFIKQITESPAFRVWLNLGDNIWAPSLHLNFRWRGRCYWFCLFFNGWKIEKRA